MLKKSNQKGLTLIELLITIAIIAILGGGVLVLQFIISQSQTTAWRSILSVDDANAAVSSLNRELRNAKEGGDGSYPLVTLDDQQIIFFSDYDFDGSIERIRYTLAGTELVKGVIEPTAPPVSYPAGSEVVKTLTTFVRNGANPIFYYYNEDWPQDSENNPLSGPLRISDTRLIEISLTINSKLQEPRTDYSIESYAQIRILKEN